MCCINQIQWQVNNICNLSCKHCFMGEKINSSISELKFDDAKETIDRLRYYGLNKVSFTLTEPFLNTDLFKVIDYCTKQGIHVNVLANGTVLGVKAKTVLNSNIDSIGISLAGVTAKENDEIRGSGVFNRVMDSLNIYKNACREQNIHIPIVVYFTVCSSNIKSVKLLPSFFNELGIDKLVINKVDIDVGNAKNNKFLNVDNKEYIYDLLLEYSNLEEKKYVLEIANISPYESLYYNFLLGVDLPVFFPNCEILADSYFVDEKNHIRLCMYGDKKDRGLVVPEFNIMKEMNNFFEEVNKFKSYYKKIKSSVALNVCSDCAFFNRCNPCPLSYYNKDIIAFECTCSNYMMKIENLVLHLISHQNLYRIYLKKSVYLAIDSERSSIYSTDPNAIYKSISIKNKELLDKIIELSCSHNGMCVNVFLDKFQDTHIVLYQIINSNLFYIREGKIENEN